MTDSDTLDSTALSEAITQQLDRLRQLTQLNVQANWQMHLGDLPVAAAVSSDTWQGRSIALLNARSHIVWEKGHQVLWLSQQVVVPTHLQGYAVQGLRLRLALTWWADSAQIFINGDLVQSGDLFDCSARILLSSAVTPGEIIQVALRLVSPNHDNGALVRSLCIYEFEETCDAFCPEPGFVADELAVLQHYLTTFAPEKLAVLQTALGSIAWLALPGREAFDRSLVSVRQQLQPLSHWLKNRQINLLGHAHLDLAWLWTVRETWEAADRTFRSVLQLQQAFPELIFCQSTPALYAWVEQHRPALFAAVQSQIAAARWEVVAGLWVEPELNLISGESIVRQVLYGQRYAQQKFGKMSSIAWLPDSFGFCWQLPQILRQGGVEFFVTQKLRWNDTTEFPHELFWWQSPDGTQILSLNVAPIGEGIDPLKMTRYACTWERQTGIASSLWLMGVGDHGGGPTRDMLETARRWQQSPFFPRLEFTTAIDYLQSLEQRQAAHPEKSALPVWNDELYLEFHRGCYTTHTDQKRSNRACERWLYQAELFSTIATLTAAAAYPQTALETAWKQMLFNQFHDILPGSSIPEVFDDANRDWQAVEHTAKQLLQQALTTIAAQITLPPPHPGSYPVVVFNPLSWERSEVVTIAVPLSEHAANPDWQIYDLDGQVVASQSRCVVGADQEFWEISFFAAAIPAVGYRLFWRCPRECPRPADSIAAVPNDYILENEFLQVTIDPQTGDLSRVFDKVHQRDVLSAPGNQLQAFQDSGQYWDAWNIDPHYAQHPLPPAQLRSIVWQARGKIQQRLRVVRRLAASDFYQDYVLLANSPLLHIQTQVDWQARHVLVKAAFPLNLQADHATYEIPCGAIARSTQPSTPQEQAKWEVSALHWADLSQTEYGVSLLNDCKHGYDSQPSQLRLTLLRSPAYPDPNADRGQHQFSYALYPHSGSWRSARTVHWGYEFNYPLQALTTIPTFVAGAAALPAVGKFLDLDAENLILTAFKRSEGHPTQWILRCYECHGESATLHLSSDLDLQVMQSVNLLEQPDHQQPDDRATSQSGDGCFSIAPWKIVSFAVTADRRH
jgi:alpha-mannosidase